MLVTNVVDVVGNLRRSVFDPSVSGRPGASEAEGGREKTGTRKQGGGPGARPQNADRPSARGV